jgi:hypothetical protein
LHVARAWRTARVRNALAASLTAAALGVSMAVVATAGRLDGTVRALLVLVAVLCLGHAATGWRRT